MKSGSNAHLRSLHSFMALSPQDIAIRVWSNPFSVDDVINPLTGKSIKLVNVPFYLVGRLNEVLNQL